MDVRRGHAVIIGGSVAGMCAARVASESFARVTVVERDALPDGPVDRPAVPQGRHLHLLMARGAAEFEALYPGLLDDMVAAGVSRLENRPDAIHFGAAGHVLGTGTALRDPFTAYVPSRPHLEWQVRRRTMALPEVSVIRDVVTEPTFDAAAGRVTGVELADGGHLPADLVIDASGRGTRLPTWLRGWGYGEVAEERVEVGIGYATVRVRLPEGALRQEVVVAGASPDHPVGIGLLRYEDGDWVVTAFGVAKTAPPRTHGEICDVADDLLPAPVAAALRAAQPLSDVVFHAYPASRWRRFDRLPRHPEGIVAFGDAVASFNPTYGQGMTMTVLQSAPLRRALADPAGPWRTSTRAAARQTYPVWTMNRIGDLTLHGAHGPQPWWFRPVGSLFDQFLGAAETDPVLAEWFLRRFSLLDSLYMVPSARLVGRTVRHNMRLWWAERRGAVAVPTGASVA